MTARSSKDLGLVRPIRAIILHALLISAIIIIALCPRALGQASGYRAQSTRGVSFEGKRSVEQFHGGAFSSKGKRVALMSIDNIDVMKLTDRQKPRRGTMTIEEQCINRMSPGGAKCEHPAPDGAQALFKTVSINISPLRGSHHRTFSQTFSAKPHFTCSLSRRPR